MKDTGTGGDTEYPPLDPLAVLRAMRNEIGDWAADEIERLSTLATRYEGAIERALADLARGRHYDAEAALEAADEYGSPADHREDDQT